MMTKNNDKHSIKEKNKKENLISLLTEKNYICIGETGFTFVANGKLQTANCRINRNLEFLRQLRLIALR